MMEKKKAAPLVNNLSVDKQKCICQVKIVEEDESLFSCQNCKGLYHKECMKRNKYCSFCHLKKMLPLKKIVKEVFVGVLEKGKAKHEIHFHFKEDLKGREL